MAIKLNAGDYKRSEEFLIDPDCIEVNFDNNGRAELHSDEEVAARVQSILDVGQLEPVGIRKVHDNKVSLIYGFLRLRAIKFINDNKLTPQPMKLRCVLKEVNDEEAFKMNIAENLQRAEYTPLDMAHCQRILRERFGYSSEKIAKVFEKSVVYVNLLRKLPQLPSEIQGLVRVKQLSLDNAIGLSSLPEEKQKEIVQEAKNGNGEVDKDKVDQGIRNARIDSGKSKGRTLKQVRKFFEEYLEVNDCGRPHELVATVMKFIDGKIKDETFLKKLDAFFNELPAE